MNRSANDKIREHYRNRIFNYRGCKIEPDIYIEYSWAHPEHEWSSDQGSFGYGYGRTIAQCMEDIDGFYEAFPHME